MSNKALGKHIQAVMPTDGGKTTSDVITERVRERGVETNRREVRKELALMKAAGLVTYDEFSTPRWARARSKRDPLPAGHHRRMVDGRCAWRKMTGEQRGEFLTWIQETEEESPITWHTNSIVIAVTEVK